MRKSLLVCVTSTYKYWNQTVIFSHRFVHNLREKLVLLEKLVFKTTRLNLSEQQPMNCITACLCNLTIDHDDMVARTSAT